MQRCIKCGREIGPDETLCEVCNRAGMATPSATQYHGTVVVAIVAGVAALAIAASWSLRGVGPYAAEVTGLAPAAPAGYEVTLSVTNEGTRAGRAKCQILALDTSGARLRTRSVVIGPVEGGQTLTVTETIAGLVQEPASVTATCS
ncbi:MAG: DUF4307 domain-containing protein [Candidatus Limnocylindria bacterium]